MVNRISIAALERHLEAVGLDVRGREDGYLTWWHACKAAILRGGLALSHHWPLVAILAMWGLTIPLVAVPLPLLPVMVAATVFGLSGWKGGQLTFGPSWDEVSVRCGHVIYIPGHPDPTSLWDHVDIVMEVVGERMRRRAPVRYLVHHYLFPFPILWTRRARHEYEKCGHAMAAWYDVEGEVPVWMVQRFVDRLTSSRTLWSEAPWRRAEVMFRMRRIREAVLDGRIHGTDPKAVEAAWDDALAPLDHDPRMTAAE